MTPIECDIKKIRNEMDFFISSNPTRSVAKQREKKIIELSLKYSEREVAIFCPEFNQVDSAFFTKKAKLVPKLPQSIDDLKNLPDNYKEPKKKERFLASSISNFSKYIFQLSNSIIIIFSIKNVNPFFFLKKREPFFSKFFFKLAHKK